MFPDDSSYFLLLHKEKLDVILSQLRCPLCQHQSLHVETADRSMRGFAQKLKISCSTCTYANVEYTSPQIEGDANPTRRPYEINHRSVLASREVGLGHTELLKMMAIMNVKGSLHHKTFSSINKHILSRVLYGPAAEVLDTTHATVHQLYTDMHGPCDGPRDITVSFDGTWHIKGHTSSIGVCFAIDAVSGFVLDYIVLSKYCAECELVGNKLDENDQRLWMEAHKDVCDKNHTGSSGSMEVAGAKILWARSVEVANFRYTGLLGDGDAAVLEALNTLEPYPGVVISKEECINHVAKRMFNALDRLVKDVNSKVKENKMTLKVQQQVKAEKMKASPKCSTSKGDNKSEALQLLTTTMGGRGRMTVARMKKWSSYYRKAIVDSAPDVDAARNAVWAIFFHSISTLDDPHHTFCAESWCFWKQAESQGSDPVAAYKEAKHDPPLPKDVAERLVPIFERLANPELLKRCMSLQTSNANESLHSTVWKRAPKSKYCGKKTVDIAVAMAVMQFNKGADALLDAVDSLGLQAGIMLQNLASKLDARRIKDSDKASLQETKMSRKRKSLAVLQRENQKKTQEGGLYEPGGH